MLIPKLEKQIRNEIYCRICGKKKEDPSFLMCCACDYDIVCIESRIKEKVSKIKNSGRKMCNIGAKDEKKKIIEIINKYIDDIGKNRPTGILKPFETGEFVGKAKALKDIMNKIINQ